MGELPLTHLNTTSSPPCHLEISVLQLEHWQEAWKIDLPSSQGCQRSKRTSAVDKAGYAMPGWEWRGKRFKQWSYWDRDCLARGHLDVEISSPCQGCLHSEALHLELGQPWAPSSCLHLCWQSCNRLLLWIEENWPKSLLYSSQHLIYQEPGPLTQMNYQEPHEKRHRMQSCKVWIRYFWQAKESKENLHSGEQDHNENSRLQSQ